MSNLETTVTAVEFLQSYLAGVNPDQMMSYVFLDDLRKATGNDTLTYEEMVAAAEALPSNGFDLTPRYADDFSNDPYLWITPKIRPVEGKPTPPEVCWYIRNPSSTASLWVKEGLLVFSHPGYAAGHMIKGGAGDFNIERILWSDLVNTGEHKSVVLDYVPDYPMTVLPVVSKQVQ